MPRIRRFTEPFTRIPVLTIFRYLSRGRQLEYKSSRKQVLNIFNYLIYLSYTI